MSAQDFFRTYLPYARNVSERTGIDPRLVLAQAALETGYGRSTPNFNFFGIKGSGQNLPTQEYRDGRMVTENAGFRTYSSPEQSFSDYADLMLGSERYAPVRAADTLEGQIAAMASSGYATDPQYGAKLSGIAEMIDLNSPGLIGADVMRAIGQPQRTEAPMGLLGQQPQQSGFWGNFAGGILADPDRRARLAMALEGMMLNPNQGVIQAAQSGIEQRKAQRQVNKTLEWLRKQPGAEPYIAAIEGGAPIGATMQSYISDTQNINANVQSSVTLKDNSGVLMTMRDGTLVVKTAGGETLTGQAAMDFVNNSGENWANLEQRVNQARREGTLTADVELGGEAARVEAEGKAAPGKADEYLGQAEVATSMIANLNSAIQAIDDGAQSGIIYNMLPNITVASAQLDNAMKEAGLSVIGSVTFGALSEAELKLAMETAVPQNLAPPELREWLVAKRTAQEKVRQGLLDAAYHFARGGSMEEWVKMYGGGAPAKSADQPTSDDPLGWR